VSLGNPAYPNTLDAGVGVVKWILQLMVFNKIVITIKAVGN
jgi:hypothetical protein